MSGESSAGRAGLDPSLSCAYAISSDDVFWSGPCRDALLAHPRYRGRRTLAVDGLHRTTGWHVLRSLEIGSPGLRVAAPEPNPSPSGARIAWSGGLGTVRLAILDVRGHVVREAEFREPAGDFFWDGRDAQGRAAPGGIYFAQVSDDARTVARRLVRLR
jgi:hypothetical protein